MCFLTEASCLEGRISCKSMFFLRFFKHYFRKKAKNEVISSSHSAARTPRVRVVRGWKTVSE